MVGCPSGPLTLWLSASALAPSQVPLPYGRVYYTPRAPPYSPHSLASSTLLMHMKE